MNILNICLIVIILLLVIILVVLSIFFFYKQKKYKKEFINTSNNKKTNVSIDIDYIYESQKKEIEENLNELNSNYKQKANQILVDAMQTIVHQVIQEHTTSSINITDDTVKGRIIGKDGRNKRTFELVTGVDLIIEKDNNFITLSSFNPIRREIAKNLLSELLKIKSIDPNKIETMYKDVKASFENHLNVLGKEIVEDKFNIFDLNKELYPLIAKLKYRTSYGQNVLNHVCEVAHIAASIANTLKLDQKIAIKTALLHDIGKAIDFECDTNHVDAGLNIAKQLNLDEYIIDAIASHHGETLSKNIYSEIIKLADTISASRPGARINSYGEYFTRVQELEKIINNFNEVNNCFVIRSGRQVRVMVNPILVDDFSLANLANKIKYEIENNEITKGFNIKVTLIKENRYEFETNNKMIK